MATVAVFGPSAIQTVERLIRLSAPPYQLSEPGQVRYGLWNAEQRFDAEQVVVCRTRHDLVEIHCHGGKAVTAMIISDLAAVGCVAVKPDQFPWFTTDSIAQQAAEDLQFATSDKAAAVLLDQMNGALRVALQEAIARQSIGEATLACEKLQAMLAWQALGQHLIAPWRIVLAGPPNVGKSSLINALVGQQRTIVHHEPGTTRDWVEVPFSLDGWPASLTDTAGIRQSDHLIETEGIRLAQLQIRQADLVLLVVDATIGWTATHTQLCALTENRPRLIAWNKTDLHPIDSTGVACGALATALAPGAAEANTGLDQLRQQLRLELIPSEPVAMTPVPFRTDQVRRIEELLAQWQ